MHATSRRDAALFSHFHVALDVAQRYFHAASHRDATLFSCMLHHIVTQRYFHAASHCDAALFSLFMLRQM